MPAKKKADKKPVDSFFKRHLLNHHRFYAGAVAAAAAYFATAGETLPLRALAAADGFFLTYLVLLIAFAVRSTPETTLKHARVEDEGLSLIALLTLAAVGVALTAIVMVIRSAEALDGMALMVAVGSVPLGWATVHGSLALHYARLYYAEEDDGGSRKGLSFPCDEDPDVWDFLYFSFVLGMTAQTSDVAVDGRRIRRSVLAHSVVSYFYNAVIIALAVNAAVQIAG
ncbi:MAG: DUF1345 domain-containing protein [Micropepsaceae bacterium]